MKKISDKCVDKNVWGDIVERLTKEHGISEYDLNRIIVASFPLWGKRRLMDKGSKIQGPWVYVVNSKAILDSIMGWKKFKTIMDKAIRYMKPKLSEIDSIFALRENITSSEEVEVHVDMLDEYIDSFEDESVWSEKAEREVNNLLYGEYDGDE